MCSYKSCLICLKVILILIYLIRIIRSYTVFSFMGISAFKGHDHGLSRSFLLLISIIWLVGTVIGLIVVIKESKTTLLILILLEVVGTALSLAVGQFIPTVASLVTLILLAFFNCSLDQKQTEESIVG